MVKKKRAKTMNELTAGYEDFIKGKELNPNGKELFDSVIEKAIKPKVNSPKSSQTLK